MSLIFSEEADHIRVTGVGFFTPSATAEHFTGLTAAIAARRRRLAPIRVIVDLRDGAPQSSDVAEYIRMRTADLYRDGDLVAIIVRSSILKLQLKRTLTASRFGVFLDEPAAAAFIRQPQDRPQAALQS